MALETTSLQTTLCTDIDEIRLGKLRDLTKKMGRLSRPATSPHLPKSCRVPCCGCVGTKSGTFVRNSG